tara:strand:- start:1466 stop:1753 length:288 start_codon:yes stop_codon:yes gene_type:complete
MMDYIKINQQLAETRKKFLERFDKAIKLNAKERKNLYKEWRSEIGDQAAREVAKFVESYKKGDNPRTDHRPKWNLDVQDAYDKTDLFHMKQKGLL